MLVIREYDLKGAFIWPSAKAIVIPRRKPGTKLGGKLGAGAVPGESRRLITTLGSNLANAIATKAVVATNPSAANIQIWETDAPRWAVGIAVLTNPSR